MRITAAIALAFLIGTATANEIFTSKDLDDTTMSLELFQDQCVNAKILAWLVLNVNMPYVQRFQRARLHWKGKDWASCWIDIDGLVYSVDEEGVKLLPPIPRAMFKDTSV